MHRTDLRSQIFVYKVLIALEFNRTVTSDCLMMVAWDGAVERVYAQIKHPIIK